MPGRGSTTIMAMCPEDDRSFNFVGAELQKAVINLYVENMYVCIKSTAKFRSKTEVTNDLLLKLSGQDKERKKTGLTMRQDKE